MSDDFQLKRAHPRRRLAVDLSQHLVKADGRQPIKCLAVDVSRSGLGIVSFESLAPQTDVILMLKAKGISVKVIWCKPDTIRENIFHVGLGTNDLGTSIVKALELEGLIKDEETGAVSGASEARAGSMIDFSSVREALSTAHTSDSEIFRSAKLTKLATMYLGFPLNHQGVSLFVLLPKDLRPAEACKLDEVEAAARKIIILSAEGGDLKKIWPRNEAS